MLFCRFPDLGRETFAGDRYYDHQRRGLPHILASPFLVLSLLTVELESLFVFPLYFFVVELLASSSPCPCVCRPNARQLSWGLAIDGQRGQEPTT